MDCRGSHLLCKEDTFLSMYFPVRPRLDSAQWGTVLVSWEQTWEGATASCQASCPHPWNPGGVGSFEGEARTAVGLENLQTFIFVLSGGKKERTLLEESLKIISVLGLLGREEWRGGGSEKLRKLISDYLSSVFWWTALSFCSRACQHFRQLWRFPGTLSGHLAAVGPSLLGWNRSFRSAPLEQRSPVVYFQALGKPCPERWGRDKCDANSAILTIFQISFFPKLSLNGMWLQLIDTYKRGLCTPQRCWDPIPNRMWNELALLEQESTGYGPWRIIITSIMNDMSTNSIRLLSLLNFLDEKSAL